jgi:gluconolactonase
VWSDIPNNRQLRWLEDDGRVSVFRLPSNNSNGNTFDFQGAQLSCEHLTRRVVPLRARRLGDRARRQLQRQAAQLAQRRGAHPDGSYWFTDPPYGGQLYEGTPDAAGARATRRPDQARLGQALEIGPQARAADRLLSHRSQRPVDLVVARGAGAGSQRLCFSPDYKKLYVVSTARVPGDTGAGGKGDCTSSTSGRQQATNGKLVQRLHGRRRQVRAGRRARRRGGQLWCSSNAGRNVGYSGVTVWTPDGKLIGRIRLPEICGNVCFGGPSATVCSWRPASRSTRCTPGRRARRRDSRPTRRGPVANVPGDHALQRGPARPAPGGVAGPRVSQADPATADYSARGRALRGNRREISPAPPAPLGAAAHGGRERAPRPSDLRAPQGRADHHQRSARRCIAEYAITMLLALAHRVTRMVEWQDGAAWPPDAQRWSPLRAPTEVRGATWGSSGTGASDASSASSPRPPWA